LGNFSEFIQFPFRFYSVCSAYNEIKLRKIGYGRRERIMKRTGLGYRKQWILIGAAILAIVIVGIFFLPKAKGEASRESLENRERKPLVKTETVRYKDLLGKVLLVGQTVPKGQVDIAAKYSGRVIAVNVDLGQKVSAGQVLVVQDTGDVDLSIAQTDATRRQAQADTTETKASFYANYQKAQSDYRHSVTNYQRYKTLYETGAVSKEALDTAEQEMSAAKAELDALRNQGGSVPAAVLSKSAQVLKAEKNIAALEKQRSDLILRAPRNGIIGYRQVEVGTLVQPGEKLLSIVDNSQMYVDCQIAERDVAPLRLGAKAKVQIESLGCSYPGKIVYISPAADSQTQTFTVRLALSNPDKMLKAGMFSRSEMDVLLRPQTLSVPKDAVQEENGKYYVFLVSHQGVVKKQLVQLGLDNDKRYEILAGIKDGDQVAISNIARLSPGMKVNQSKPRQQGGEK